MTIDNLKDLFVKIPVNAYPSMTIDDNNKISRQLYKNPVLDKYSEINFNNNIPIFYLDRDIKTGELVPAEPRYIYRLKRDLTETEYNDLFDITSE